MPALVEHHHPTEPPYDVQRRIPGHQPGAGQRVQQHVRGPILGPGVDHIRAAPPGQVDDLTDRHVPNSSKRRDSGEPR